MTFHSSMNTGTHFRKALIETYNHNATLEKIYADYILPYLDGEINKTNNKKMTIKERLFGKSKIEELNNRISGIQSHVDKTIKKLNDEKPTGDTLDNKLVNVLCEVSGVKVYKIVDREEPNFLGLLDLYFINRGDRRMEEITTEGLQNIGKYEVINVGDDSYAIVRPQTKKSRKTKKGKK